MATIIMLVVLLGVVCFILGLFVGTIDIGNEHDPVGIFCGLVLIVVFGTIICLGTYRLDSKPLEAAKYHAKHGIYPYQLIEYPDGSKEWREIPNWQTKEAADGAGDN